MPAASDPRPQPSSRPQGDVHRLRGIPGGYDIDRLPISVPRADGELLESWLHRTAHRYGLHPRAMLKELGVDVGPQRLLRLQETLNGTAAARVADRLGLEAGSLTERSPLSQALFTARTRWRTEFRGMQARAPMRGSRWCPRCLAETGMWQEIWADPLYVYCDTHFVHLLTQCPTCHAVPYATTAWATSLEDHDTCPTFVDDDAAGARYRRRCGTRFDRVDAPRARDLAVYDQDELLQLAGLAGSDRQALVTACGIEARADVVFEAVLEMVEQATGAPTLPIPAEATHAVVDAIRGVTEVLRSTSLRAGYSSARAYGLVWRTDVLKVLEPKSSARMYPRNPLITAMWLEDLRGMLAPDQQLRFRMGSPRPRYPDGWQDHDRVLQARDARPGLPISAIPQLAWAGALDMLDAGTLGLDTLQGRAFTSMCLAKYGTTRRWREIATGLGLPAWSAARLQSTWRDLASAGRVQAFLSALDALFHRLHDAPPPIDYEMRRSRLWNADAIQGGGFVGRIRRAQPTVLPFAEVRRRVWAIYTGGAEAFCPPSYATPDQSTTGVFNAVGSPRSLIDVEAYLPDELRDGPLTWAPP